MLDELNKILESIEFENSGYCFVTGSEREENWFSLRFRVRTGIQEESLQNWQAHCHGVETFGFSGGHAYGLLITDDDPILWDYNEPRAALYCKGVFPDKTDSLIGALYRAHREAVGDSIEEIPFGRGLNATHAFAFGAGVVASGALPLLRHYYDALSQCGVSVYMTGKLHPPQKWIGPLEGGSWQQAPFPEGLRLLAFGDNWVVAKSFEMRRIGSPST